MNRLQLVAYRDLRRVVECHVYVTPRLEGEDIADRMWGGSLNWTVSREGVLSADGTPVEGTPRGAAREILER